MKKYIHKQEKDLHLTADCVETVHGSSFFVSGTYQLEKESRTRNGSISLFKLCENEILMELSNYETSKGILDLKWSPQEILSSSNPILGGANSDGSLSLYTVDLTNNSISEKMNTMIDENVIMLSLDWNNRKHNISPKIAVSTSIGNIVICDIKGTGIEILHNWKAHDLFGCPTEAWITTFSCWNENIIYSGADDGFFKGWDLRMDMNSKPVFKNTNHEAGVCSLQCNLNQEHIIASGSYDSYARIWDDRMLKNVPLKKYETGGGVWRIKWHPLASHSSIILLACMRGGVKVIDTSLASDDVNILIDYDLHGSENLAYGVDWIIPNFEGEKACKTYVGSASFYNRELRVWEIVDL